MADASSGLLGDMDRAALLLALERAKADAIEAIRTRDYLTTWAERLLPYLDEDASLTVAVALERYKHSKGIAEDRESP